MERRGTGGWRPVSTEIEVRAERVVAKTRRLLHAAGRTDKDEIAEAAHLALMQEINNEMRQVLAFLQGRIELGLASAGDSDQVVFPREVIEGLLAGIDRGETLLNECLDPMHTARQVIELTPEPFELREALLDSAPWNNGLRAHLDENFPMDAAPVLGDRWRLTQSLVHLVKRFAEAGDGPQGLVGSLRWEGETIEGFVGRRDDAVSHSELLHALASPLELSALRYDIPLARAVIERHGGTLVVKRIRDVGLGYAFTLPALGRWSW